MFEIQTNDHHYLAKSIFLGALILVLGITTWTNVFAQRVIKQASVPKSFEVTMINNNDTVVDNDQIIEHESADIIEGDISSSDTITVTESSYSGLVVSTTSGASTTTGTTSGLVDHHVEDTAIIYARKIEALITVKGQETRLNMLATMNKFLDRYTSDHPMYHIIDRMVDIITLGDIAHKLEYCTQYEGEYVLDLFGMPLDIYSIIRYDNQLQRCQITYQYPDKSVHTCRIDEQQKILLAKAMKQKQGLTWFNPDVAFESVVEGFLRNSICFESQGARVIQVGTGSLLSGSIATGSVSTSTVTSRWRNWTKK